MSEDLLQETFLRIHRARGGFAQGAPVVPWAYAIARNAWLDHVRSAKVRTRHVASLQEPATDSRAGELRAGPEADTESHAIARETALLAEQALARLPAPQREAFVLLRYEGLSVAEAADVLGSSTTAVKLRAFRAYEALRDALELPKKTERTDGV